MLELLIYTIILGMALAVAYAIYLIPPVKRVVRNLAGRYREFLFTIGFGLFVAAVMYFIVLPRI